MTLASRAEEARKKGRSRVSNGTDILPGVDGRSLIARRYRDICAQITADQGGADRCTEARLQLIRRFAACSCLAEALEARLALGKQIDIGEHGLLCSSLVRLGARIGLGRHAKDIVPSLSMYLESKAERCDDD
jgi:hypothetical protein